MTPSELVTLVERGYRQGSWHGPNLTGALRGVTATQAAWRPQPERHDIWEIAVHAAYWKYRVWRLLDEANTDSFGVSGSDWFLRPQGRPVERDWAADRALLDRWHERLIAAIAALAPADLGARPGKSERTRWDLITGAAAHDLYHAGQVRLLRRMMETKRGARATSGRRRARAKASR